MEKDFEILNHTADVGIIAYGDSMNQAFANAAQATFSLITDLENVQEVIHRNLNIAAPDKESLLVKWLNELIYLFDTEYIIFKRFDISQLSDTRLKARGYGEKVDQARHQIKNEIKAATYHLLEIKQDNGYRVQVILDI